MNALSLSQNMSICLLCSFALNCLSIDKINYCLSNNTKFSSNYTVKAMDVDELRRSQKRHKKATGRNEVLTTPSPDSDLEDDMDIDEEEVVSTPSAENAERNMMSMLSVR